MTRNNSDDATRRDTGEAAAVEGLLAYAMSMPRWSRAAERWVGEAVRRSRALAAADPAAHVPLLVRSLRTQAKVRLRRGRPGDALEPALESVALARPAGGAPLAVCLGCLAEVYRALRRHDEAAAALEEAETTAITDPAEE